MNRLIASSSVSGQPNSAPRATFTRVAIRSVSTRTPSQSNMTSSNGSVEVIMREG